MNIQPENARRLLLSLVALFAVGVALAIANTTGCNQSATTKKTSRRAATLRQPAAEQLERGLQYLDRLGEFDQEQAIVQASYHFNRWLDAQTPDDAWQVDPLTQTLPREIRTGTLIGELDQMRFQIDDVLAMLEASWGRDVADWVSRRPTAGPLAAKLESQLDALDDFEADQLLVAARLFDWTVRNIQLDELTPYPFEALTSSPDGSESVASTKPPPQRAVPGPGYQLAPWEALLYGHGDALTRARVFILLARQQGIDVVTLALPGLTNPPRPRAWLTAALIGQQLYLFDTRLGLPIPGPDGNSIATLEDAIDHPQVLASLDVGSQSELLYEYPFKQDDLDDIIALIDASPQALSRKLAVFEAGLTGENQLVLTVQPSDIETRLEPCRGVTFIRVWSVPFETLWYRKARNELLDRDKSLEAEEYLTVGLFQGRTSLARARYQHFRGAFDMVGEEAGAKKLYLQSRISQRQIDDLGQSPEVQEQFGLEREQGEREIEWLGRLAVTKLLIARSKLHASYWVGLAHHDSDSFNDAITWLHERTLSATPDGPWTHGASYNLARAYEAAGRIEDARQEYLLDDSHQAHGNTLRAKLLRQLESQ